MTSESAYLIDKKLYLCMMSVFKSISCLQIVFKLNVSVP